MSPIRRTALLIGISGLILCGVGVVLNSRQFFQSYLLGYLFWIGMSLGCLAVLMLHHLVGGRWGFVIQRLLEAGTRTFPLMALLFVPLLFGLADVYVWARPEEVAHDALLQHKRLYLNTRFFLVRLLIYFAVWMALAYLLNRWSLAQDRHPHPSVTRRLKLVSGLGLVLYGGTVTMASVDWVMSLEPHWFSTIYGVLFMVSQALGTLALMIIMLALLVRRKPMSDVVVPQNFQDVGNLLLAFVMLWAYMAFSQYLIIWSGNLPEEIHWYIHRTNGGWKAVVTVLMVFHFLVPFLLLLSRGTKRNVQRIAAVAGLIIAMRLVDLFWLIVPAFHHEGLHVHGLDFAAPIGMGGIWMAVFIWQLQKRPLLPRHGLAFSQIHADEQEAHHV